MITTLSIAPTETHLLREIFANLTPHSCPYDYNFHLHTVCSDGKLTPEAVIAQAVQHGLKGLAITDHHTMKGYYLAKQWLKTQEMELSLLTLWTGVEINANLAGTEVHLLGYGFDPDHPALIPYIQSDYPYNGLDCASLVIQALHEAGGLVVLAHPFRYHQPASLIIPAAVELGIDGLEAFYAYGNPKPWESSPAQTEEICYFSDIYGLLKTCGTDSHGDSILRRI